MIRIHVAALLSAVFFFSIMEGSHAGQRDDRQIHADLVLLQKAIDREIGKGHQDAVTRGLKTFPAGEIEFKAAVATDDSALPPLIRPNGISRADWEHVLKFWSPEFEEKYLRHMYWDKVTPALIDLNEDGKRDLAIFAVPNGGASGHWDEAVAYRRDQKEGFVRVTPDDGFLLDGSGKQEIIRLVRINGRAYFAHLRSFYDSDAITLYRSLQAAGLGDAKESLFITYRHEVKAVIPEKTSWERKDDFFGDPTLLAAVTEYFGASETHMAFDCPVPEKYYGMGRTREWVDSQPWFYVGEIKYPEDVALFSLRTANACYRVRMQCFGASPRSEDGCYLALRDHPAGIVEDSEDSGNLNVALRIKHSVSGTKIGLRRPAENDR